MPNSKDRGREPTISLLGTQVGCSLVATVALLAWWLWGQGQYGKVGAVGVVSWALLGNRISRAIANSKPAIQRRARRAAAGEARRLAAWRATPCRHGVVGGLNANACEVCVAERDRAEHERSERTRREDLRRKALALERSELARLATERRRRVHSLLQLSPRQFERAIAEFYEAKGFEVTLTPSTNDEGRDVIAVDGNQTLNIECKRYAAGKLVGRPELQKLVGALPNDRTVAVFVTTSGFSGPAIKYAEERGVTLIDGLRLDAMLRETFPSSGQKEIVKVACPECGSPVGFELGAVGAEQTCPNGHTVHNRFDASRIDETLERRTRPMCDSCGSDMVLRKGSRGKF